VPARFVIAISMIPIRYGFIFCYDLTTKDVLADSDRRRANARKGAFGRPGRRRRRMESRDPSCLASTSQAEASLRKCEKLGVLISRYWETARRLYSGKPEALSGMLLTIMELWTALDRSATDLFPLLLEYQTGFRSGILDGLVLSKREQLDRLAAVEDYLEQRRARASSAHPPWQFRDADDRWSETCFAVRYYNSSAEHQRLHKTIDLRANIKYYRDVRRLRSRVDPHLRMNPHPEMDPPTSAPHTRRFLDPNPFVWPLPRDPVAAKAIVFELRVPPVIDAWRHTTLDLLIEHFTNHRGPQRNVGSSTYDFDSGAAYSEPRQHPIVSRVLRKDKPGKRRFVLSTTKRDRRQYYFYDTKIKGRVSSLLDSLALTPEFSYAPSTLPSTLRQWIRSGTHTLNDVLARQCDCPENWSLEEFRAFGNVRGGTFLQWHNILLQLTIPSLDFGRAETLYLILQAVNEAGPRSVGHGHLRDAHGILGEVRFGHALLSALQDALERHVKDWESHIPLYTFLTIATRLLSLSPEQSVQEECLAYLSRVRHLAIDRVHCFVDKLFTSETVAERRILDRRILLMAFVCHATFDVGPAHFASVLSDRREAALLAEAFLQAAEHMTPSTGEPDPVHDIFRYRWHRLSYEVEPWFKKQIVQNGNPCLDMAVKEVWPAYAKGTAWSMAPSPHQHVLVASSADTAEKHSLSLQYDLLTGRFLVDGSPLSTLPLSIREHETYRRLFGDHIFRVIPSYMTKQGMRYSATSLYLGHELHFGVFRDEELILRTRKDNTTYELIPEGRLSGDFPARLLADYAHWLVLGEDKIEFRPLDDAWLTSKDSRGSWNGLILEAPGSSQSARLVKCPSRAMIDIRSKTARLISDILRPLERPSFIHIALDRDRSTVDIDLPRLRMAFKLVPGETDIASTQYKGYIVDWDQHIGTLTGLVDRLILRPRHGPVQCLDPRLVIIPYGCVSFRTSAITGHASTRISTGDEYYHVRHHAYWVDTKLGYLRDSGALQSKLFLCYLHSTSTHCLPDELTGRTGTEEALRILKSAAVRSVDRLEDEDIHLLHLIGKISPIRQANSSEYTPAWSSLSPVAQSEAFSESAAFVLQQAALFERYFHQDARAIQQLPQSSNSQSRRACMRASAYRVSQYGAEQAASDTRYKTQLRRTSYFQNHDSKTDAEAQAYRLTKYIIDGDQRGLLHPLRPPTEGNMLSRYPRAYPGVMPWQEREYTIREHPTSEPEFSATWLEPPSRIGLESWYKLVRKLQQHDEPKNKYKLLFFFAGLTFAHNARPEFIQLLLTAATTPTPPGTTSEGLRLNSLPWLQHGTRFLPGRLKKKARQSIKDTKEQYIESLSLLMSELPLIDDYREESVVEQEFTKPARLKGFVGVDDLFKQPPAQTQHSRPRTFPEHFAYNARRERAQPEMRVLLDDLTAMCRFEHERKYVGELRQSLASFESLKVETPPEEFFVVWEPASTMTEALLDYVDVCRREVAGIFAAIYDALSSAAPEAARELSSTTLPRITPVLLLERLSRENWPALSEGWQKCLVDYAMSLTTLQRAERLVKSINDKRELARELLNTGHEGWDPLEFPEWLLFEVEAGILIRPVQNRIASWMMKPPGGLNNVMQLNMGEGKSSVIIPIVASKLADASRLVRVIVTKPQSRQMMHSLKRALGGLLGRRIFRLPFSRDFKPSTEENYVARMCNECKENGGVILIQPEHILSFKMSGLEALLDARSQASAGLMGARAQKPLLPPLLLSPTSSPSLSLSLSSLLVKTTPSSPSLLSLPLSPPPVETTPSSSQVEATSASPPPMEMTPASPPLVEMTPASPLPVAATSASPSIQPASSPPLSPITLFGSSGGVNGQEILGSQHYFEKHSRDIIDESDENFSAKLELVYTIGTPKAIELSPLRWLLVQSILGLVADIAPTIHQEEPHKLELSLRSDGSFPRIRILDESVSTILTDRLAERIYDGGLTGLPYIARQKPDLRRAIVQYILKREPAAEAVSAVENKFKADNVYGALLLLRGLVAGGILVFSLQKRWRVNYGRTPNRKPPTGLAVPYRAKDAPAPRSEYSHPDLVILLTCLSYYYGGLGDSELSAVFERLSLSDGGEKEYQGWIECATGSNPLIFGRLSAINIKDRDRCASEVYPHVRYLKPAVDYYLAEILFAKEMREYPQKLSESGWSIAETRPNPTTGFSGTSDMKYLLPLGVQSLDLEKQRHTNASVLNCLLRPENTVQDIYPTSHSPHEPPSALGLLRRIAEGTPHIRVIIDVGAQIMELDNAEVARHWLAMVPAASASAAIFFDSSEELCVVARDGTTEAFLTSSYAVNIGACLVFLDEAHTRGTDLRLPDDYRAAVTLGPAVTKDQLVQGEDAVLLLTISLISSLSCLSLALSVPLTCTH